MENREEFEPLPAKGQAKVFCPQTGVLKNGRCESRRKAILGLAGGLPEKETPEMEIVLASSGDEPWIRQLLTLCGLPQEDITPQHLRHFWAMKEKGQNIGVVGLELFDRLALLRSLAVGPHCRKKGYGSDLIKKAEEYAAALKIEEIYLLTVTAERESFFAERGYRKIERNSTPPAIQGTAEFQGLCPVSSVCMVKKVRGKEI